MALIKCPNCEREISDKAVMCPGCGKSMVEGKEKAIFCPECGVEIEDVVEICPNCGFVLETEETAKKPKKLLKRKGFWIIMLCLIILLSVVVAVFNKAREELYIKEVAAVMDIVAEGGQEAERVGNLICSVWQNAIYGDGSEETDKYTKNAKDFNEALSNLFADEEIVNRIQSITSKQAEIDKYLVSLRNPPERYDDVYDEFKELYYAYSDFTDFVISCQGSLNSFSQGFKEKDEELSDCFREIKVMMLSE